MGQSIWDYGTDYFSISMINTNFLKRKGIQMRVKDFKDFIKTQPNEVAITGGAFHIKHCKIWNIENIKSSLSKQYLY